MNVLIVGGGGREHALAWKAAQSPQVSQVLVAPGNAGIAQESGIRNIAIDAADIPTLVQCAKDEAVALTIVGPEVPLCAGIVDRFSDAGLPCFGPRQSAARLEGSKSYAKAFMERHGIPTARYAVFSQCAEAQAYLAQQAMPIVIKANGLAAGKGVVIAANLTEAVAAVKDMLQGNVFGEAGQEVVIEEFLQGQEASFIVMCDGQHILPLASSQDHKPLNDGDRGPNTGGMGAYSPASVVTETIHQRIIKTVIEPAVMGLAEEGEPYVGFLYAGLMIDSEGVPKVLEFNCRFGDPEAQPIMLRMQSDLITLCQQALQGNLDKATVRWDPKSAVGVVLACEGYPGSYRTGDVIDFGEDHHEHEGPTKIFHAGTALNEGHIVTAGGRVLCVCGLGDSVSETRRMVYERVSRIHWDGMYYRRDIGRRDIGRRDIVASGTISQTNV